MCYCVGALRLVAGREPDAFAGAALRGRGGVDERFAGTLQFGDLTATFACAFHGKLNVLEVAPARRPVKLQDHLDGWHIPGNGDA